jgi:cytidylate kinase
MQIAIDGPAGAGKSSVAREVARRLAFTCLDTGAMYRAVTLQALKKGIDLGNGKLLVELVRSCKLDAEYNDQEGTLIYLDGENVTAEIRGPLVNQNVSVVAKSPELRRELVFLQRELADKSNGIVMEGRDIGTNVLVNADYKFFLTASPDERTRRRWLEMRAKGLDVSYEELYKEIALRDRIDQEREEAPLKIAPEALVIDTTPYTLEEVVEKVLSVIRKGKPKERGEEKVK